MKNNIKNGHDNKGIYCNVKK